MLVGNNIYITPNEEEEKDLIGFFAYIYEFNESYEKNFLGDFKEFLSNELSTEYKGLDSLTLDKKWILLHLIFFNKQAQHYELDYLRKCIKHLIHDIEEIESNTLFSYLTLISNALSSRVPNVLSVRPKERVRAYVNWDEGSILPIHILFQDIGEISKVFKKYIRIKNIKDDLIDVKSYGKKNKEYITIHERIAEYFLTYVHLKSSLYRVTYEPVEIDEELKDEVENVIREFIKSLSHEEEDRISAVTEKCTKIIINRLSEFNTN